MPAINVGNGRRPRAQPVHVNVYDLSDNSALYSLGLGVYHSGIEVDGREFTFASGSGVFSHAPRGAQGGAKFRERVYVGDVAITSAEIDACVARLKPDWPGSKYNVLTCNCNHFADALCTLLVGHGIPLWINRLSGIGAFFSCCIPSSMLGNAPVQSESSQEAAASSSSASGARAAPVAWSGTSRRMTATAGDAGPARGRDEVVADSILAGLFRPAAGGRAATTTAASDRDTASLLPVGGGSTASVRQAIAAAALARTSASASSSAART